MHDLQKIFIGKCLQGDGRGKSDMGRKRGKL